MRNEILHPIKMAERDTKDQNHREASKHSPRNEIRREDRGVPARNL